MRRSNDEGDAQARLRAIVVAEPRGRARDDDARFSARAEDAAERFTHLFIELAILRRCELDISEFRATRAIEIIHLEPLQALEIGLHGIVAALRKREPIETVELELGELRAPYGLRRTKIGRLDGCLLPQLLRERGQAR